VIAEFVALVAELIAFVACGIILYSVHLKLKAAAAALRSAEAQLGRAQDELRKQTRDSSVQRLEGELGIASHLDGELSVMEPCNHFPDACNHFPEGVIVHDRRRWTRDSPPRLPEIREGGLVRGPFSLTPPRPVPPPPPPAKVWQEPDLPYWHRRRTPGEIASVTIYYDHSISHELAQAMAVELERILADPHLRKRYGL
jgi:hypothetical protein